MKITSQIAVAALFIGLMSCSDAGKTENTTTASQGPAPATTAPATVVPNQGTTPATTVGLNPPHGQPNHAATLK